MRKAVLFLLVLLVLGLFGLRNALAFGPKVGDIKDDCDNKVTICHSTNAQTNPYQKIDVSIDSIITVPNGHDTHNGPIWFFGISDHSWGDIIPDFSYQEWGVKGSHLECDNGWNLHSDGWCYKYGHTPRRADTVNDYGWVNKSYSGKNWPEGRTTLQNNCVVPPAPINCQWSAWSACSVPCGGGTQTRTIVVQAQNGGAQCEGSDTKTCNPQACIEEVLGCTDSNATNYNPKATKNDESCVYPTTNPSPTENPTPTATPNPNGGSHSQMGIDGRICNNHNFGAWAILTQDGNPVAGVNVKFVYHNEAKLAKTEANGRAGVDYGYVDNEDVQVIPENGYPSQSQHITLASEGCDPTPSASSTTGSSTSGGQVLGATTMAGTGILDEGLAALSLWAGTIMTAAGSLLYAKKR